MSLINPEVGAIPLYLWDTAQENIVSILQEISDNQAAINPLYKFLVDQDLSSPQIESVLENNHLANVTIGAVTSRDDTNFDKTHIVTYIIECYAQGFNEPDPDNEGEYLPADKDAKARLKYLCAMVEYGLTQLKKYYLDLAEGEMAPDKITLEFNLVEDAAQSATPYAPATFQFVCLFPYSGKDFEGLPELRESFLDVQNWASEFLYPVDP